MGRVTFFKSYIEGLPKIIPITKLYDNVARSMLIMEHPMFLVVESHNLMMHSFVIEILST